MFTSNTISSLQTESNRILNTFTKVQNDLQKVNSRIGSETATKAEQITNLQNEIGQLEQIAAQNAKVVTKLQAFLED